MSNAIWKHRPVKILCFCAQARWWQFFETRPFGLEPARLLCPSDSPGKTPGAGHHFLNCRQILYPLSHQGKVLRGHEIHMGQQVRHRAILLLPSALIPWSDGVNLTPNKHCRISAKNKSFVSEFDRLGETALNSVQNYYIFTEVELIYKM